MLKKIFLFIIIAFAIVVLIYFASSRDNTISDNSNFQKNIMSQINESNFIPSNVVSQKTSLFEEEVASFSTNVFGDSNRLENIRISCDAINGTVLENGETFSFNDIVGKPTEDKGYKEADVIIGTKTEKGLGGR